MKKISTSILSVATLAVLSTACVKIESLDPIKAISKPFKSEKKKKKSSRITNAQNTNEQVTIGSHNLNVVSADVLQKLKASGKLIAATDPRAQKVFANLPSTSEVMESSIDSCGPRSMKVGFPISFLGEQNMMGAVITKVSDKKNEELGNNYRDNLETE